MLNSTKDLIKRIGLYNSLIELAQTSDFAAALLLQILLYTVYRRENIGLRLISPNGRSKISVIRGQRGIYLSTRHIPYIQDVVEHFDYYFQAVEPQAIGAFQVVDFSEPTVHRIRPSGLPFYFTSLAEPLETNYIYLERGRLQKGDVVLDLGAYCGLTTYCFSQAVGNAGHVYALEPDKENYAALSQNVAHHDLTNVTSLNTGIWSSSKRLLFQSEANMGSGIQSVVDRRTRTYEIDVVSLDDLCEHYGIDRVAYVKMDIEGSEIEVLKSSKRFLEKYKPRLMIEAHIIDRILCADEIHALLDENNYACEVIPQANLPLPLIYAFPRGPLRKSAAQT